MDKKYLSDFQLLWKTGPAEADVLPSAYPPVKANAGSGPEFSALKEAKKPINISGRTALPKKEVDPSIIPSPKGRLAAGRLEENPLFSALQKSIIFEEVIPTLLSKGRTVEQAPLAKHPARVIQPEPSGGIASKNAYWRVPCSRRTWGYTAACLRTSPDTFWRYLDYITNRKNVQTHFL